jgi:hypothetical protein
MIFGIRLYIEIGGNVIARCPRLEILSVRHRPLDMARVHVPDPEGEAKDLFAHGDPVRIEYGYRGGESAVWQGTLRALERVSRDQVCLTADSLALPLATSFVAECYTDDSSLSIARHILGHAGLPLGRVDIPDEIISRLPVSTLSIWQAIRQLLHSLHRAYGHNMRRTALWLGADGLNLGDFDEPGDLPVIATGENLIRHLPAHAKSALHMVETALLPGLSHSRRFRLVDSRLGVDQAFRALDVLHAVTPERIKTNIRYGREHG